MDYRWAVLNSFYPKSSEGTKYSIKEHREIYKKAGWTIKTNYKNENIVTSKELINSKFEFEMTEDKIEFDVEKKCYNCREIITENECLCGESYCSKECQVADWDNHKEACLLVQDNNLIAINLTKTTWNGDEIYLKDEFDSEIKEMRKIIAKSTNLEINDSDEIGDGDQSPFQHLSGTPGQELINLLGNGMDFNPLNEIMSRKFPKITIMAFFGNYDAVLTILNDAKAVSKQFLKDKIEKRVSLIRLSAIMSCIVGACHINQFDEQKKKKSNHLQVARLLINYGANVNAKDIAGYSLHHKCTTTYANDITLAIALLLIQNGADVNSRNRGGSLTIYEPVMFKRLDCVYVLLEGGCQVDVVDQNGISAIKLLSLWPKGLTVLKQYASFKDKKSIGLLIEKNVDIVEGTFKGKRGYAESFNWKDGTYFVKLEEIGMRNINSSFLR